MLPPPSSRLQFSIVHDIEADITAVFDVLVSEVGMRHWVPLCRSAVWKHPPGVSGPGLGSVREIRLPAGTWADERIVAWEPGRGLHYVMQATSLPITALTRDYVGVTELAPLGLHRTRLVWNSHFDTPGPQALLAPLVRGMLYMTLARMATQIKKMSEASRASRR